MKAMNLTKFSRVGKTVSWILFLLIFIVAFAAAAFYPFTQTIVEGLGIIFPIAVWTYTGLFLILVIIGLMSLVAMNKAAKRGYVDAWFRHETIYEIISPRATIGYLTIVPFIFLNMPILMWATIILVVCSLGTVINIEHKLD